MLEFETRTLGRLKLLAFINDMALIEKMNPNEIEKYIVAYGFDMSTKSWRSGSYRIHLEEAMKEFGERILKELNTADNENA